MATNKTNPQGKTAAEKLIDLVTSECELIHDQKKKPFAITCKGSVRQVFGLHSNTFKEYIANLYYRKHKSALSDLTLKAALSALTGKAVYDGKQYAVHHRIAKTGQSYWLDLCNADWEAVEISASGWAIKSGSLRPPRPAFAKPKFEECRGNHAPATPRGHGLGSGTQSLRLQPELQSCSIHACLKGKHLLRNFNFRKNMMEYIRIS